MPAPDLIRVKISSEAAGSIALTPVVVQEMEFAELLEQIVGLTGKDTARIQELLKRGSVVAGASRFRWAGFEVAAGDLANALAAWPDPDPARPFRAENCTRIVLRGAAGQIGITREAAGKRRTLQRRSFWDALLEHARPEAMHYAGYSYRERADHYRLDLAHETSAALRQAADMLAYATLAQQIRSTVLLSAEFFVTR
jgi:hypothetical protein